MLVSYLAGLIAFTVHALVYFTLTRLPFKLPLLTLQIISGILVHISATIIGGLILARLNYWQASSIYMFGCVVLFFVTSTIYTSVSISALRWMFAQPGKDGTISELYKVIGYPLFEERARLFVEMGQVEGDLKEGFLITASGRRTAMTMKRLQSLIGIERGTGLYTVDVLPDTGQDHDTQ